MSAHGLVSSSSGGVTVGMDHPLAAHASNARHTSLAAMAFAMEAAHKLKAAFGTLGADALAHAAFEIERRGRAGEDVTDARDALLDALDRFHATAEAALALLAAPA